MDLHPKPFVWQMIREAVEAHGNKLSNVEVKDWILKHYPNTNVNTILNQIIICTVNHESRIHYKENQRPRRCQETIDFLYRPAAGKLELYDPRIHGIWEIFQDEHGILSVKEVKEHCKETKKQDVVSSSYIDKEHLRLYLAKNLDLVEEGLELYVDLFGNDGVQYNTEFGPIDLLAVDKSGAFVIIEIKHDAYPDASSGQILKFKNWVKRHLAMGKPVRSYLIGPQIPENVRYSLADCQDVFLKEYELSIKLKDVPQISDLEEFEERSGSPLAYKTSMP
ncbi:RecB family-like nuclease [Chitinispirillum alkaliphilum]|nr:RecB family-like nuclease [Chitinispirillum alkaliphilum]